MNKRLIPLALARVRDEEPIEGRTRLQKMVFVIQQNLIESGEFHEDQLYEFFPYDYGPFSKELAEDIDSMIEEGLLEENSIEFDEEGNIKYLYSVKEDGERAVERERKEHEYENIFNLAKEVKRRFNENLSLPEVIDEVYEEYPRYAENSVF